MLTVFISLCAGLFIMYYATRKIIRSVVEAVMPDNNASLMEIIFTQRKLTRGPAITVVGGGTGLSTLLRGMKYITNNCTAVVTVGETADLQEGCGKKWVFYRPVICATAWLPWRIANL